MSRLIFNHSVSWLERFEVGMLSVPERECLPTPEKIYLAGLKIWFLSPDSHAWCMPTSKRSSHETEWLKINRDIPARLH